MSHDISVLSLILSGGKGQRLYPLTRRRAKSAVPFAGKLRLIDIALSNCLHSGFKRIFILTQWVSAFLHNYVTRTYQFNTFEKEFIEILAAEQTFEHSDWYHGTADAVRMSWTHFRDFNPTHYLILSSDQLYRMDLNDFFRRHMESGARVSVAAIPVGPEETGGMGVMKVDAAGNILEFVEKPADAGMLRGMTIPYSHPDYGRAASSGKEYAASMGIYLFDADVLENVLESPHCDFGSEILPGNIGKYRMHAYFFHGFWKDVGTISSYYRTSLSLSDIQPSFNFFDEEWPIYTNETDLPATTINSSVLAKTLTSDGCIITGARLENCIIGPRTVIDHGTHLNGVIHLGNDRYETDEQKIWNREHGVPNLGVGSETSIAKAIVDENVRIGNYCRIGMENYGRPDCDTELYSVRDGIIVIPEGSIIPDRTVI